MMPSHVKSKSSPTSSSSKMSGVGVWRVFVYIIVITKLVLISKHILRRCLHQPPPGINAKPGLGDAFDELSGSFHILNRRNVTWSLSPSAGCDHSVKLLLMISSGPRNIQQRQDWRDRVKDVPGVRIVFLVAEPVNGDMEDRDEVQERLRGEAETRADILQPSIEDGHRKLGYKILSGYVWSFLSCRAAVMVGKTDDNTVLDLETLMKEVRNIKEGDEVRRVMCGSGTQHRNMRPLRSDKLHMTGNWSISREQVESDYHPDFCSGFLYLTSPQVGAELVQAGLAVYGNVEVEQIEDSLITGELRQRLDNVPVLGSPSPSPLWTHVLSHCPWLTLTKLSFANDLVITKSSSRKSVMYVGPIDSPALWRYYICLHIEFVLELLESTAPGLAPQFIFDICKR